MKPSRSNVMRYITNRIQDNSGKVLSHHHSRGLYSWVERNRSEDQSYYITLIRGNFIETTRVKYVIDGRGVNVFREIEIPVLCGEAAVLPETVKDVLLKVPIKNYSLFPQMYKDATPDLNWFTDEEEGA